MLHITSNLLAESTDIASGLVSSLPIFAGIIAIYLIIDLIHKFLSFMIPFNISSIAESNNEIQKRLAELKELEQEKIKIENEKLELKKQSLELEKQKLQIAIDRQNFEKISANPKVTELVSLLTSQNEISDNKTL